MSAGGINKRDRIAVRDRDIGELRKLYIDLSATDVLVVTRIDRGRGKACLYARRETDQKVFVIWPAQVRVVQRYQPPRAARRTS